MSINDKRSYTEYTVSTPTKIFAIGFDNFDTNNKDVIHVTLNGTDVTTLGYTVQRTTNLTITITPAIPSGVIRLQRETLIDEPFHKFTAGALFTAKSMDENFAQTSHLQQEIKDGFTFVETNINSVAGEAKAATVAALALIPEVRAASAAAVLRSDTASNAAVSRADTSTAANVVKTDAAVKRLDDATFKTATVSTTEAGTPATVNISGTGVTRKIAFTVPKGDKGLKGDTGASGALISATASTGAVGSEVVISLGGTPEARTMALTIPRGATGVTGASGTITAATATTGAAGTAAEVTLGGTTTARTFAFTIPRGDKGEQGATGTMPNFYADTTSVAPNTYIGSDGVQRRSTYTFGSAATRGAGYFAGGVPIYDYQGGLEASTLTTGYIKAGARDAPKLAYKKITTSYTRNKMIAHGLTASSIVAISGRCVAPNNNTYINNTPLQGYYYYFLLTSTSIAIYDNDAGYLINRDMDIFITYESN